MRKLIERVIQEEVGVPKNIYESADLITDRVYYELKNILSGGGNVDNGDYDMVFSVNTTINDLTIKRVNFSVQINYANVEGPELMGAGFNPRPSLDYDKFVYVSKENPSNVHLMLKFYIPSDDEVSKEDFFNYFLENRGRVVNNISHELKHAYDYYKKPEESFADSIEYQSVVNYGLGFIPLHEFFFKLYYSNKTENLVRATEVYSSMRDEDIDDDKFLEFLLSNEIYVQYNELANYSYDMLINSLRDNIKNLRNGIAHYNLKVPRKNDDVIQLVLKIGYMNIANLKVKNLSELLTTDFIEEMIGFDPESKKGKYFRKNAQKFGKYQNNYLNFYKTEIEKFNKIGNLMIKKISKLYSIAKDSNADSSDIIRKIYNKVNPQK